MPRDTETHEKIFDLDLAYVHGTQTQCGPVWLSETHVTCASTNGINLTGTLTLGGDHSGVPAKATAIRYGEFAVAAGTLTISSYDGVGRASLSGGAGRNAFRAIEFKHE